MALTTAQLTFYDMVDDEISFAIYSEGVGSDGKLSLTAVVLKQGAAIDGNYTWYSSTDSFQAAIANESRPQIQRDAGVNEVLKCDFSYPNENSVAYTAYFNVYSGRMVYTACPSDGNYLPGDLWYVGNDYVKTAADGSSPTASSTYANVLLVAQHAGSGVYKSTDWQLAVDYSDQFGQVDKDIAEVKKDLNLFRSSFEAVEGWTSNVSSKVQWTEKDGLLLIGQPQGTSKSPFKAQLAADKLLFIFGEKITGWIGGENIDDQNPQFFVNDATIANTLDVGGRLSCKNFTVVHPRTEQYNNALVLQPEGNGSFSIVVGKN